MQPETDQTLRATIAEQHAHLTVAHEAIEQLRAALHITSDCELADLATVAGALVTDLLSTWQREQQLRAYIDEACAIVGVEEGADPSRLHERCHELVEQASAGAPTVPFRFAGTEAVR